MGSHPTMPVQPRLLDVPATPKLTERQQWAYDYIRTGIIGHTTSEVGCFLHTAKGKHAINQPCKWCESDGISVLRSVALKPLVIRRQTGLWEARNPADRPQRPSAQETGDLPDDLFGGAA